MGSLFHHFKDIRSRDLRANYVSYIQRLRRGTVVSHSLVLNLLVLGHLCPQMCIRGSMHDSQKLFRKIVSIWILRSRHTDSSRDEIIVFFRWKQQSILFFHWRLISYRLVVGINVYIEDVCMIRADKTKKRCAWGACFCFFFGGCIGVCSVVGKRNIEISEVSKIETHRRK